MNGLCRIASATGVALGSVLASGAPAATVGITGGFMTVSGIDPTGAWVIAGNGLTALGTFDASATISGAGTLDLVVAPAQGLPPGSFRCPIDQLYLPQCPRAGKPGSASDGARRGGAAAA